MSLVPVTLLVVAKAPVPGRAKTRLAAAVGDQVAAEIAAAALLDTLDAVAAAPVAARVVALTGELDDAIDAAEIHGRLEPFSVIPQRGNDFADRLTNAHADAAALDGHPVLQIGMDTPQVTAELLADCGRQLTEAPAVLGLARDGGWWVLGVQSPALARCLRDVPMSRPDTGALTLKALCRNSVHVTLLEELSDFDVVDDIAAVRADCSPASRFAQTTRAAGL
ncbi:TIGR04282 family arsenosugar biosynthesis glycosyltransferase [Mycobacterium sp.]|uniref:TIGR04282 family arsenosugar biosynthesis glycosyltransferase n=1 Tax=Mycobacterium sp. TaxID=1785 RepID=UPI003C72E962